MLGAKELWLTYAPVLLQEASSSCLRALKPEATEATERETQAQEDQLPPPEGKWDERHSLLTFTQNVHGVFKD